MKKFSIDTVIDLIKQSNQIDKFVNLISTGKEFVSEFDIARSQSVEMLKELKAYKDAEEQGLLLRLPCPIGTKLYGFEKQFWIDRKGCKGCVYYCDCGDDSFCDYMEDCPDCTKIIETTFELKSLERIGESLFLTKEEAEAELKALKALQEGE